MIDAAAFLPLAASVAADPVLPPESRRRGMALIAVVILLGMVLISSSVSLVLLSNRRRRLSARPLRDRPAAVGPDPWTESARRLSAGPTDDDQG